MTDNFSNFIIQFVGLSQKSYAAKFIAYRPCPYAAGFVSSETDVIHKCINF